MKEHALFPSDTAAVDTLVTLFMVEKAVASVSNALAQDLRLVDGPMQRLIQLMQRRKIGVRVITRTYDMPYGAQLYGTGSALPSLGARLQAGGAVPYRRAATSRCSPWTRAGEAGLN